MKLNTIDVIGVPMDYGGNRRGVDMGPSVIRYSGLNDKINALGLICNDLGNIAVPLPESHKDKKENKFTYKNEVYRVNKDLYNIVLSSHIANSFPLVLGGDHSLAVGSALATKKHFDNVGIIWIDAHSDYNTSETTLSANMHGMPLSAINGVEKGVLIDMLGSEDYINTKNTVIVAARDLDKAEVDLLRESNVTVFSMQHIDHYGLREIMRRSIKIASKDTQGFHLSFDLDAISPKEAPGVGTPVKGGLTFREAHLVMEMIYSSNNMLSLDIVELNPIMDVRNVTGELAVSLILSALGKNII